MNGHSAMGGNRPLPESKQGRDFVAASSMNAVPPPQADECQCRVGGAVLVEQFAQRRLIEVVESNSEGLVFVVKRVEVGCEVQLGKFAQPCFAI